jgi:hypothetical protein
MSFLTESAALRRLAYGVSLPLALAVPTAVSAQLVGSDRPGASDQHLLRIGFAGGVVVPTADARNALKNGVQGQGFLLVNLFGFPLRLNLGYQHFDLAQALTAAQTGTSSGAQSGTSSILGGVAGTQINLLPGPVRPYILAGLGGFNVNNMLNSASGSTSSSQFNFGIDGGAGLAVSLGRLSAFVEGRVQNVYTNKGVINARSIQSVPVSFGILF